MWFWIIFVAFHVLLAAVLFVSVRASFSGASYAVPVAAYICSSAVLSWSFLVFMLRAGYRARVGWALVNGCLFGSSTGVLVLGAALARWHLTTTTAMTVAACCAVSGGTVYMAVIRRSSRQALAWYVRQPADERAAEQTFADSLYALKRANRSTDEAKIAELNAASAAIIRSRGDEADGLVIAERALVGLLHDPPRDWPVLLAAALSLVDAVATREAKHGDSAGYEQVLDRLADVAAQMPPDLGAQAIVHSFRANFHAALAVRMPPGQLFEMQADAALAAVEAAIVGVTPTIRAMLPGLHTQRGLLIARFRANPGDLAAGIATIRSAIALAGRSAKNLAFPERSLAALLMDWAWHLSDQLTPDASDTETRLTAIGVEAALTEAQQLGRRALRHGRFDGRADALQLQARLLTARAMILGGPGDDEKAAAAWRDAAYAAAEGDPFDRVRIGQAWVDWAESTQQMIWCAEAYAYLMSTIAPAVAVRYLAEERERVLGDLQSRAEEAGYWLAEAGRISEAAVALDLGRAVSLTEVVGRERPELATALRRVHRPDLLERYQAALDVYDTAAVAGARNESNPAIQRAWADYDAVAREISQVVDIDVPGAALSFAGLAAAARDGPVVYLAVSEHGGYAIIVTAAGQPRYLRLPGLARGSVAEHADALLRRPGRSQIAAVASWLWESGIQTLARELRPGALVTIVPVGLLTLVPVHAAGGAITPRQVPDDWLYLADLVRIRYAHNAQTLLRCHDRADRLAGSDLALLAISAPNGDVRRPLHHTVREVAEVASRWVRATTVSGRRAANLPELLAKHTVWHVACHCDSNPAQILESALLLDDARISLRRLMALRPAPKRLAVLSACETHLSGTGLPDEAMGMPAGLLHAGFAGVVASHWTVNDRSMVFFMARFHDLWHRDGVAPATALAQTQQWLRAATYADLDAYVGGVLFPPANRSPERLAQWAAVRPYAHPYHWAAFALTGT